MIESKPVSQITERIKHIYALGLTERDKLPQNKSINFQEETMKMLKAIEHDKKHKIFEWDFQYEMANDR